MRTFIGTRCLNSSQRRLYGLSSGSHAVATTLAPQGHRPWFMWEINERTGITTGPLPYLEEHRPKRLSSWHAPAYLLDDLETDRTEHGAPDGGKPPVTPRQRLRRLPSAYRGACRRRAPPTGGIPSTVRSPRSTACRSDNRAIDDTHPPKHDQPDPARPPPLISDDLRPDRATTYPFSTTTHSDTLSKTERAPASTTLFSARQRERSEHLQPSHHSPSPKGALTTRGHRTRLGLPSITTRFEMTPPRTSCSSRCAG